MRSYSIPDIEMPLPFTDIGHPDLDDLERGVRKWLGERELITDDRGWEWLARARPDRWAAHCFPGAPRELLLAISRYTAWVALVDDRLDRPEDRTQFVQDLIAVSLGKKPPSTAWGYSIVDVLDQLSADRSPQMRTLFTDGHCGWLRTHMTEVRLAKEGRGLEFHEYLRYRSDSFDRILLCFCEAASGVELPAAVRNMPALTQSGDRALEWLGLHNDIYSAKKELADGFQYNWVINLSRRDGGSLQRAVDAVNDVLSGLMGQFVAARAAVAAQALMITSDPDVIADVITVVESYSQLLRGSHAYHLESAYYA